MHLPDKATELTDNNKSKMFFMVNFYIRQNGTLQQSIYKTKEKRFIAINPKNTTPI
jgi:hypothetical protein